MVVDAVAPEPAVNEERLVRFAYRLSLEFPAWSVQRCWEAAQTILRHAELMAFEVDAQAGIDEIPVVGQ